LAPTHVSGEIPAVEQSQASAIGALYMIKKFVCLIALLSAMSAVTLFPQEATTKSGEGTLMLEKKNYPLKHALAYETTIDNEQAIVVVLSGQAVAGEKLKETKEAEKQGGDGDFNRPYLKLIFKPTGELKYWTAAAGGTMLGRRSGSATGELKLQDKRVIGKANQANDTDEMFPSSFDTRFDVALLKAGDSVPASSAKKPGPAANVKPSVSGVFKGNGKDAKLTFVSAHWREPFSDKPSMDLVFTEKDHSKDKKPDLNASFGRFGSALIISLHDDGEIFGCQVVHSAHQKQGFSSIGSIHTNDFTFESGKVEGDLTTDGQVDTFGETWEVKIKFVVPLGEIPKEFQPAKSNARENEDKQASTKSGDELAGTQESDDVSASKPMAGALNVKDLALTKDATDVQYNTVVEHVVFKSKSNVKKVCAELAANLKAQGWANDGMDLVQPQSSILKRKRGEATLTIFVKPEDGVSEIKMFTEGLSWDKQ
jgi:hypothetical protein